MQRKAEIKRKTKETDVILKLNLDGTGECASESGSGFFNHMMDLLARHGGLDLKLKCKGDTEVDLHHSVEDTGICLGLALAEALGEKKGINRYGCALIPMDESLARTALDLGGRTFFEYNADIKREKTGEFDTELVSEFFKALSDNARINLHIDLLKTGNTHHCIEAIFKSFARALKQACTQDPSVAGAIPSTKGAL